MAVFAFSEAATVAMRAAASAAVRDLLDAGAGPGEVRLYSAPGFRLGIATLASPAGVVDSATGALSLQVASQAVSSANVVLDYVVLTDSDGQEVLTAPAVASNTSVPNAVALPSLDTLAGAPIYLLTLTIG